MSDKPIYVTFVKKKLENEFESLKEGKFEDKQLYQTFRKQSNLLILKEKELIMELFIGHNTYRKLFFIDLSVVGQLSKKRGDPHHKQIYRQVCEFVHI